MQRLANRNPLYVGLSLLATVIAFAGFWPTYFGPLIVQRSVEEPVVIHLHAVVYVGWLGIFIAQALFAVNRRMDLHRKLGSFGIGYGVLVIVMGVTVAIAVFGIRVRAGQYEEAQARLLGPLADMLFFAPVFAAAIRFRRNPETHKRLMIVAMTLLLVAAVGRMAYLGRPWPVLLVWSSPLLIGAVYDIVRRNTVPWIYLLGCCLIGARAFGAGLVRETSAWRDGTTWLSSIVS